MPNLNTHGVDRTLFLTRAMRVFNSHRFDLEKCGALALWIESVCTEAVTNDDTHRFGILLSEDGLILAHTVMQGLSSRRVVNRTERDSDADLAGELAGVALTELTRRANLRVVHVIYHDVCTD